MKEGHSIPGRVRRSRVNSNYFNMWELDTHRKGPNTACISGGETTFDGERLPCATPSTDISQTRGLPICTDMTQGRLYGMAASIERVAKRQGEIVMLEVLSSVFTSVDR